MTGVVIAAFGDDCTIGAADTIAPIGALLGQRHSHDRHPLSVLAAYPFRLTESRNYAFLKFKVAAEPGDVPLRRGTKMFLVFAAEVRRVFVAHADGRARGV